MVSFDQLIDYAFNPMFIAIANFTAFAVILAVGLMTANQYITFGAFGFFIAGASIGALMIADRWAAQRYSDEEEEAIQPITKPTGVVKDGVPKNKPKVQTLIEI